MKKMLLLLSLIILLVTNSCIKVKAPTTEPDLILRYADNQPYLQFQQRNEEGPLTVL